jgi:hypothetical protein
MRELLEIITEKPVWHSPVKSDPERRISERVPVSLEAAWDGMSGNYRARISDISLHGCFLETIGQTSVGELIRFRLLTPTGRWILIEGEVTYCQPTLGFGVRFTEINKQDHAMIKHLVEYYR